MLNFEEIEARWQKAWADARLFEAEPSAKQGCIITAAFPYTNAPQHIGHLRTYGTTDAHARYKRLRGLNVLFPMGFHATGAPIIAFTTRIKNNDKDLLEELHMFHIPDEAIAKMTDPLFVANYFINDLGTGMLKAGFSIDWRRKFVSIEPMFSKFVEWQFGILQRHGLLVQGKHPVGWCPLDNQAVGMHDTKHDVEPEIEAQVSIKFKVDGEDAFMLCTTYRPETIFGVTNVFVNESASYVQCTVDGSHSQYYVSKATVESLKYQYKVAVTRELTGKELLALTVVNPMTNEKVPVLHGFFVKDAVGTGIVMSVPAHAPFDYAALERLRASGKDIKGIRARKVLDVKIGRTVEDVQKGKVKPIHTDIPALAYLEILGANANSSEETLEAATKLAYKEESHWGKMTAPGYEGMAEPDAREKIKAQLIGANNAIEIYVLVNAPVYCRDGTPIVVKVVDNQWFINYGDAKWKALAKEAFKGTEIYPGKQRAAFEAALDWIDLRAVARARGLGTKFPLDKSQIIEPLSDSTLYPALYTISYLIRDAPVDSLTPAFFDFVFLGKGDAESLSKSTGIRYEVLKRCKEEFEYWYGDTSRHSAPELIFNHLTMYTFNHALILDRKYWPKRIVVNGMVLMNGDKMSKSLGNIVPLLDGIQKHGADTLRLVEIAGSELLSDAEFNDAAAGGVKDRLAFLSDAIGKLESMDAGELKNIDYWLYSKLNRKIANTTKAMDAFELRDASTEMFYNSVIELKRYAARGGANALVLKDYLSAVSLMLNPLAPHLSEEFWHRLGNTTFSSTEKWPIADESMISDNVEALEKLIDGTIADVKQVAELMAKKTGKPAKKVTVIVAEDWKRKLTNALAKEKNVSKALDSIKDESGAVNEAAAKYAQSLAKRMNEIMPSEVAQEEEFATLTEACAYIGAALKAEVSIVKESDSKSARAERAAPLKPSIEIEA